jgi:hypothetical protein
MPRLVSLCIASSIVTAAGVSHAADSSWLVCKGVADRGTKSSLEHVYLAANLFEHRGAGGDTRDLGVTLLKGDHVGRGDIIGKRAGDFTQKAVALTVKSVIGKHEIAFTGTAQVAEDLSTITLVGKADVWMGDNGKPKLIPIVATLTCETLDDLAIGQ